MDFPWSISWSNLMINSGWESMRITVRWLLQCRPQETEDAFSFQDRRKNKLTTRSQGDYFPSCQVLSLLVTTPQTCKTHLQAVFLVKDLELSALGPDLALPTKLLSQISSLSRGSGWSPYSRECPGIRALNAVLSQETSLPHKGRRRKTFQHLVKLMRPHWM